ncbi:flavin reductase family protein [uncultured Roseibium sp.]|uniref:flavin reductase family protein n=1 Tax=uncultured Roseibium sp. TaxID=1936171 RepID=UPI0032167B20
MKSAEASLAADDAPFIDPADLRNTLGCFATGVAIVTTLSANGRPVGMTINSFNSVSMDPPLVLWSIARKAPSYDAFHANGSFVVNILSEHQHELCLQFSRPSEDKFAGVDFEPGLNGIPQLTGAAAHLECMTHDRVEGGDHTIIIGRVMRLQASDAMPLLFHRGILRGFDGRI